MELTPHQAHIDFTRPTVARRVIITYKNMPVAHHVSHIGLGVSALNTAKVLRQNGISADVWPILGAKDLAGRIASDPNPPSHVIICAPWIPVLDLQAFLVFRFPHIKFAVLCHSNVGFLQNDPQAIKNFREDLDLEQGAMNFNAGGNSHRLCDWVELSYGRPCTYLPNLYFMESTRPVHRRPWSGGLLKIGAFGAVRALKNHLSSAAAALQLANDLNVEVELHMNVSRVESGATVVRAVENMLDGVPNIKLVKGEWLQWPRFRALVKSMHILMQPSFTETFNMVTADGAAESVPSVVSDAIEWAPDYWKAEVDNPLDIARVAKQILTDSRAGLDGFDALAEHDKNGLVAWKSWVGM